MKPIAGEQDLLKFPLNELLGTPAQVRLLRVLTTQVVGPISAADAAKRTGLTEAGTRRALDRLCRTGFVRNVGGGRSRQFVVRESDPLAGHVVALFRGESDRYDSLLKQLRDTLDLPDIQLAWIELFPSEVGAPLHIGLVSDAASQDWIISEVRRRVSDVEELFDLTVESHHFTRADMPQRDWPSRVVLAGVPPGQEHRPTAGPVGHPDRDRRALAMSEAIREQLIRDPSLAKRASRHLERLLAEDQGGASRDLREWQSILARYSHKRLVDFLTSASPRAQRLRQSSPFFAVLSPDERDAVLLALERRE